ncbi:MAG: hypothetical protein HWN70_12930 [Desulfobacterales bacterium]|nr:hypothetical protein [Desulfobacterales bacterium]
MSGDLLKKKVEDMPGMPADELKDVLPRILDEIGSFGTGKMLEEIPDLLSKIIGKLVAVDAAKLLGEVPGVSDKFMDLLWEGVGTRAPKSEELRSALERTSRGIHVNLEASDSPLRGHFTVSQGKLSGGSGLLHFKEEDYKYMGPTEILLKLLTGELALGSSNLRLQTAGHSGWASLLAPILRGISKIIKGK